MVQTTGTVTDWSSEYKKDVEKMMEFFVQKSPDDIIRGMLVWDSVPKVMRSDVINSFSVHNINSRKSLDFLGEIFSEYLNRFVCENHIGSEYFLRDMFLKYPNILMEIILKDSKDIFKNNLNKFINSETCKISLLRHGGNLPVYVDLKEDDHTKYRYL